MRFVYHCLFLVFFLVSLPYYFWRLARRGDWQKGLFERFGFYRPGFRQSLANRKVLWLHAVSVGEVNVCARLIARLAPKLPEMKLVVSTTTTTGMAELRKQLPTDVETIYYPVDWIGAVKRAFRAVRPAAIVLVEAEIWPAFLWTARDYGTPVCLVNARLSDRSFQGYRRFRSLFQPLFQSLAAVGAQHPNDERRWIEVGCRSEAVRSVGNMKFDAAGADEPRAFDARKLLDRLGVSESAPVLVAGSTHPGEEAILADIYRRLKPRFPKLFLIVVPRHFERANEVAKEFSSRKLVYALRTELSDEARFQDGALECLLVNTTGELRAFYRVATVIFVGKSLAARGGQNPIEPAALGKAVVFGPHMENFPAVAPELAANGGAIQVQSAAELESVFARLIDSPDEIQRMGARAKETIQKNQGAVDRTVDMLMREISADSVAATPAA